MSSLPVLPAARTAEPPAVEPPAAASRGAAPPAHLADLDLAARREAMVAAGEPGYRAGQVSHHYFGRLVRDPAAMTDLPAGSRERIAAALLPSLLTAVRQPVCDGGDTRKMLWRLHDGALVESVLMRYPDRVTACVSSQAGCGMGCPFCATGQAGLTRNLSTAEIVDQVVWLAGAAAAELRQRLSHVVFMGMGEPLANYDRVVRAVGRRGGAAAGGSGTVPTARHSLHSRACAGDPPAGGRRSLSDTCDLPARAG